MPPLTGDPKSHPDSEFAHSMTGHCLCRSITVTITDSELFTKPRTLMCHCANCRATSGSSVATNLVIDKDKVEITEAGLSRGPMSDETAEQQGIKAGEGKGRLRVYADYETGSGEPVMRSFCDRCGNPIKSESVNFPGKVILKMGIFPRIPAPEVEGFAAHRQDWEKGYEGVPAFKIAPGEEKLEE